MSKKSKRSGKKKRARNKRAQSKRAQSGRAQSKRAQSKRAQSGRAQSGRAPRKRAQSVKQNPSTSWFNVVSSSPARLWGWIAGMVVVLLLGAVILWFALNQGEPVALTPTAWPTVAAP